MLIPCKRATELMSRSLDGKLPVADRLRLFAHLRICEGCRRFRRQIGFLRLAARHWPGKSSNSVK